MPTVQFIEVVAYVALKRADGNLRLRLWIRERIESFVRRVELHASVAIEQPISETSRIAQLPFEGPSIDPPVNQVGWVVLACWGDNRQAGS
jgi:hypothetical protein